MPNYYHHEDYVSEKDMRLWRVTDKAEQRKINWDIRLEYYADRTNTKQFVKMLEKWYNDYDGSVPTLTMRKYVKIATFYFHTNLKSLGVIINRMIEESDRLDKHYGWTD